MKITEELKNIILEAGQKLKLPINKEEIKIEHPADVNFGDYSTNIAMALAKEEKKNPKELATLVCQSIGLLDSRFIEKVEVAGAGFINFYLKPEYLIKEAEIINYDIEFKKKLSKNLADKKIMVEFAHPNTHKELHIGHMRTLITGESLARIFQMVGVSVFRANYQGDIGPHVAKSIWGTKKILTSSGENFDQWETKSFTNKAHLLGKGYALGCTEYEENKPEIDKLNQDLYDQKPEVMSDYTRTREWSLGYYNEFYQRFGTKFDKLFFESEITENGKKIVESLIGNILQKSDGAIIFDGEKYGLHKRVFETSQNTLTYEGKELGLAYAQKSVFEYDKNIHVVANEQAGYFKVVIKVMELMDEWFKGRQFHLPMGMVQLIGKKMSSRTGEIITVDSLLDEVKSTIRPLIKTEGLTKTEIENVAEAVTLGSVKFSILKSDPTSNSIFDIKKSVDIEGDSGPYLQYTYARCKSVLSKTQIKETKNINETLKEINQDEMGLLKVFYKFEEKIIEASERFSPSIVAEYILEVARKYNEFYAKNRIIGESEVVFRLFLTQTTASVIKIGLNLLGIDTVDKM